MGRLKRFFHSPAARATVLIAAAVLLFAAIALTFGERKEEGTALETRLVGILTELDEVKSARAMVTEEEGRAVGAVVIFEGKDSILTRSHILDITASVLCLDKRYIQIYSRA